MIELLLHLVSFKVILVGLSHCNILLFHIFLSVLHTEICRLATRGSSVFQCHHSASLLNSQIGSVFSGVANLKLCTMRSSNAYIDVPIFLYC